MVVWRRLWLHAIECWNEDSIAASHFLQNLVWPRVFRTELGHKETLYKENRMERKGSSTFVYQK